MEPLDKALVKEARSSSATSKAKTEDDRSDSTPTPAMYPVKSVDGLGLDLSTASGATSPGLVSLGSTSSSNGEDDDAAFSEAKQVVKADD